MATRDYDVATEEAVEELWLRGVDMRRRRLRSRVLVELRCRKRGHLQARVYPTSHGPLLLPIEDNGLNDRSSADRLLREDPETGERRGPRRAQQWVLPADWREVGDVDVPGGIGSALLLGWPELKARLAEGGAWRYYRPERLLCRCGSTALPPIEELEAAVEDATRTHRTGRVFTR